MRKILYLFSFVIGFVGTFVLTFPAKTVVGYFLTQNKINYSKIEGNIFNIKIYDVELSNVYLPIINIENNIIKIVSKIDMENFLAIDLIKRKAKLKLTELALEKYQKDPKVKGILSTSIKFMKNSDFIVARGNGNLLIKSLPIPTFNNTEVRWKLKIEDTYSKITATLKGRNIDGKFDGKLIIPITDTKKIRIKGKFIGKIFGRNVQQEINLNPFTLRGL